MPSYADLLAATRAEIREVAPAEVALGEVQLLDVREPDELSEGGLPGAIAIPRGHLESRVEAALPDRAAPVVVYCAGGARSVFAARTLRELGYGDVRSLAGGFTAWKAAGRPVARGDGGLSTAQRARYARHLILPEVGLAGQQRLLAGWARRWRCTWRRPASAR